MKELIIQFIIDNRAIITAGIGTLIGGIIRHFEKKKLIQKFSQNGKSE